MVNILAHYGGKQMMENARTARLWQAFHHLSEDDKDLILMLTKAAGQSERRDHMELPPNDVFYNGDEIKRNWDE